jgi:pimeloyl-ACP methyl ester carboxylesterase
MSERSERTTTLRHNRVDLALHTLRDGDEGDPARRLLLLHGLGERSPREVPSHIDWPGSVYALDFTGHGDSTIPHGGGYTAEILMGDADAALAHLGPCTILGRGLGAYVAMLIAGARAELVRGAVLCDGPGLFGGPSGPTSPLVAEVPVLGPSSSTPDPFALIELSRDIRPEDYSLTFARQAIETSDLESPLAIAAMGRPPWLARVVEDLVLEPTTISAALAGYSR